MNRFRGKRHHNNHKKRLPFWRAVSRWGFSNAFRYELRHPRRYPYYPIWFIPLVITWVLIAIFLYYYYLDILIILFYVIEIILASYLMYRLIKRFDKIRIRGSLLRLWGLKILSGLISALGIYLLIFMLLMFPLAIIENLVGGASLFTSIITFGYQWHTPYVIPLLVEIIGIGLCMIGAYLLFKFKIQSGNIIWVGG